MSISLITRTNTIDEWRIQTNQSATTLNNLETGTFTKSNGVLTISGNSSVVITANGTSLQVSNSALFQSNVTISGDAAIGVQETATGNVTMGGVLVVRGPGTALQVSNNAIVNGNMQVTQTITTNNITANSNVTVVGNESVGGILRVTGSGDVLYVNTGKSKFANVSATDLIATNGTITTAVIDTETVDTSVITNGVIVTGNVVNLNSNISYINTATITTETIGRQTVTNSDISYANVTSQLNVQSALVKVRGTGTNDDALIVSLGKTTLQTTVVEGNLAVSGTFTQTGNLNFEVDTFTLNANTGVNKNAYITNVRPIGNNSLIIWNETDKYWQISQGNTYSQLNNILDASFVVSNVTSNSVTNVGSASAVKAAYDTATFAGSYANSAYRHANSAYTTANTKFASAGGTISGDTSITGNLTVTGTSTYLNTSALYIADSTLTLNADLPTSSSPSENAGIEVQRGTSSNTYILWNEATDKWTFTNDGSSYQNIASAAAESYANSAYIHANSAFTKANNSLQSVSGTSGIILANTSGNTVTLNLSTTAVTAGSYGTPTQYPVVTVDSYGRITGITTQTVTTTTNQATFGVTYAYDKFNGDGSTLNFNLTRAISAANTVHVFVNGVAQEYGTVWDASGALLSFTSGSAPPAGANNVVIEYLIQPGAVALIDTVTDTSNTTSGRAATPLAVNTVYTSVQTAGNFANSAYRHANSAYQTANSGSSYANSAYTAANTADQRAVTSGSYANSAYTAANTASSNATSASSYANSAYIAANTASSNAASASSYANSAFAKANTATVTASPGTSGNVLVSDGSSWISGTSGLGYGQTWQDMTSSRSSGSTYTNNTGKPIMVSIGWSNPPGGSYMTAVINGVTVHMGTGYSAGGGYRGHGDIIVPAGASYTITLNAISGSPSIDSWCELR